MRIGSLFSGIGGLERGLELAGLGHTVWQVELNEYCRAVLAKHWPNAERFEDVSSVGKPTLAPVDLICGGFPCQDVSSAGKRAGLAGARSGLWFEYLRIVRELRPQWVVVENVASGARRAQSRLCRCYQLSRRQGTFSRHRCRSGHRTANLLPTLTAQSYDTNMGGQAGPRREDTRFPTDNGSERHLASDAHIGVRQTRSRALGGRFTESGDSHWRTPFPDVRRVVHGLPARLHGAGNPALRKQLALPSRRIAALGNAVVPQCAEVIGHVIMELAR